LAIHDAQLTDRLKRRIQTLETLHKAAQAIAKQTGNLDQTLDQILEQALLLLGDKLQEGAHSYIALLTSKNVLGFAAARPKAIAKTIKKVKLDLQEDRRIGIAGRTVKTRDPQIVNDVREDPDYLALDERVTSELAVPIRDETDVIGVIGLAHPKHSVFDTQDCQALEILASYAAYYIRSAKSIERLAGINEEEREMVELTFNDTSGSFAGQFYYGEVVHDLRQVLTQIQQTVRLLHDDSGMRKLSSNSQKMLGKLQDRVTESGQAIDQYLEDTQEKEQKFARQDINAIIDHTIRLLRGRLDDASIEVDLSGLERGLPFVYVNRVQILMIMFNLVTNAIDALQEVHRPRKIRIATRICDEDTRYIEIIIQDNGCGIKKENQKRIFEPRFTTKGKKGRGLGLFGTRRLLDKHFGSISVLSQHLKGTTFNVRIPKS
jgi:signal transduction histidine kinase